MATLGAGVLHNRSVELAKKHGVALVVRSSLTTEEGTVVKESVKSRDNEISGVAGDDDAARIAVMGIEDTPGTVSYTHLDVYKRQTSNCTTE